MTKYLMSVDDSGKLGHRLTFFPVLVSNNIAFDSLSISSSIVFTSLGAKQRFENTRHFLRICLGISLSALNPLHICKRGSDFVES